MHGFLTNRQTILSTVQLDDTELSWKVLGEYRDAGYTGPIEL